MGGDSDSDYVTNMITQYFYNYFFKLATGRQELSCPVACLK
jgi:hypothetical protein